jgi:hypothetical protein
VVDPYLLFHEWTMPGLTESKPAAGNRGDLIKPYLVRTLRARTVILGTSRDDVGLDPESPAWAANVRPVFNFGVPGSRPYSHLRYLQHAAAIHTPQFIVVSVDFLTFLEAADPNVPYPRSQSEDRLLVERDGSPSENARWQMLRDRFSVLVSFDAVVDSARTLTRQTGYVSITREGYSSGEERFFPEIHAKGQFSVFRDVVQREAQVLEQLSGPGKPTLTTARQIAALRQMLAFAAERNMEVKLFISPAHAFELENIRVHGLRDGFEHWKYELVHLVSASSRAFPRAPPATITDFSGYHAIATEAVPEPGDVKTVMQWYWDPAHYRPALGSLIISDLFADNPRLGVRLDPSSFCARLQDDRQKVDEYLRSPGPARFLAMLGRPPLIMRAAVGSAPCADDQVPPIGRTESDPERRAIRESTAGFGFGSP